MPPEIIRRRPHRAFGVEAAVARRVRRVADDADREAVYRARLTTQKTSASAIATNETRAGTTVPDRVWRQGLRRRSSGARLREVVAVRVLPRSADQIVEHLQRDIDQHQAREDFVDAEPVFRSAGSPPRAAPPTTPASSISGTIPPSRRVLGEHRDAGAARARRRCTALRRRCSRSWRDCRGTRPSAMMISGAALVATSTHL